MKFRTKAIHVGQARDSQTGAVVAPIHMASTFVQPGAGIWGEYDYSRTNNPTRKAFETTLASLESGHDAMAFASGMAATHGACMLLKPGDHVLAGSDLYGGTYRLLHKVLQPMGIETTLAPSTVLAAFEKGLRANTKMVWIESIGNPLMTVPDLQACAEIAHGAGAVLAVDNTIATPVLVRPLEHGADIVMHSVTKYIGGHSDVLGGALIARDPALFKRLKFFQNASGGVLGPMESFLASRGLKTLELRVLEQSRTAQALAEHLEAHPKVRRVNYPGLKSHAQHDLAKRQMPQASGAMISFEVAGDDESAKRVVNGVKLFQLAVSLGAVESLIAQPAAMSHASYDRADRLAYGISDELIRLSVGLEAFEDLRDDLDQALAMA